MTGNFSSHKFLAAVFAAGLFSLSAAQGQYNWSADFNNLLTPPGMMLRGNAQIPVTSGVSNTGCLALTPAARGMQGDVILPQFWGGDEKPAEVRVRFSLKFGGNNNGVLGDGFSLSVTSGIPNVLGNEDGFGPGPYYSFDTFSNSPGEAGLEIRWPFHHGSGYGWGTGSNPLAPLFPNRSDWYNVDIHSLLHSKQQVIRVNGTIKVPMEDPGSAPGIQYSDARIILAARTGDAFNAHLIDNLSVDVTPYPVFRQQPLSRQVTSGTSVMFETQTNFNTLPWRGLSTLTLVGSATSEWQIRHPGGNWTVVPYTTLALLWGPEARPSVIFHNLREDQGLWEGDDPAWSITGTEVRCVCYWHNGYATATPPAVLKLMPQPGELPGAITLWNSSPQGCASVQWPHEEGKVLRLTPAQPDCSGGFVFDELSRTAGGQPARLDSLVGTFQLRGSLAPELRADGISFNLAGDLPNTLPSGAGEEGAGSGLRICFDAYSNGPDDPTGIDVIWRNQLIARLPMAVDVLFNDDWVTFYIRISNGGLLDLALNGETILGGAPLPGWTGIPSARMAFYGRTGSFWQQQDVRELAVSAGLAAYVTSTPELSVEPAGGNLIRLRWTVVPDGIWELYESPDLMTWTKNASAPETSGQFRVLNVPKQFSRRFFRLQKTNVTSP